MPILEVKALPQRSSETVTKALQTTCLALAEVCGCHPNQVWATWEEIRPGCYVEGDSPANSQPKGTHPPIATLTAFEGKSPEQIEKILRVAAKTLSSSLGIPNNIFMTYVEARSGRVIAGDGVVRKKS
jgi:phenylpyruvate tautomerase PptA (4-oxalocrotonate tautomerase family)